MKILINALLFSVLGAGMNSGAVAAKYYKWTDENGVTHYGAVAPQGKESQSIDVRTGESRSAATDRSAQSNTQPATPADQPSTGTEAAKAKEKEQALAKEKQDRALQEQRRKNCEIARENAELLRVRARVRANDPDTGELRYLSPDEKKAREEATAKSIEENCD